VRSAAEQIVDQADQSNPDQQRRSRDHQQHRNEIHGLDLDAVQRRAGVGKF
jgi:hypothetical protein